jgi:peptidoglycan/xylan/chitin deacetylase (PgdA/CDA1 family)
MSSAAPTPTAAPPPPPTGARSGATRAVWRLRSQLTPERRAALRRATDPWVGPVGSVRGARVTDAVALTFDDGPGEWTEPIVDVLGRARATATFFMLVDRAQARPDIVRRVLDGGHEIGLHGTDHERLTTLPVPEVRRRLAEGRLRLERCTGAPVRWFRPPFGSQSPRTFVAARRCGLEVVVWTADADDWNDHEPQEVAALALDRIRPGGILLLHDGFAPDARAASPPDGPRFDRVDALDRLLTGLADRGLRARSVGDLVAGGRPERTAWFRP